MLYPEHAMEEFKGRVHSLESFGSVDGPGVRFVVFMQGCRMRCRYCHNPETWSLNHGKEYSVKELLDFVLKYRTYWGKNSEKGGVTVSGGEPLLQIEFVTEFLKKLKEKNVHTALDTSGQPFSMDEEYLKKFDRLIKYTDLVILDIKQYDSEKHRKLTGYDNANIFKMARYLDKKGIRMWIRHVLVPGLTDDETDLTNIGSFIKELNCVDKVEILPYHSLGMFKWDNLGIEYPLKDKKAPTVEEIVRAENLLK